MEHIPGLRLAGLFHEEVVGPLMARNFPGLPYAAALIGPGSEVFGFDTEMSMDHGWGTRVQVFLADCGAIAEVRAMVDRSLPTSYRGYPVIVSDDRHAPCHRVEVTTFRKYVRDYLGFDLHSPIAATEWLAFPEQKLRTLIEGAIYRDDIGLDVARRQFEYYPHDVWLYLLAMGWHRIGQEEHLVGRAGFVGDELGASIIASRLVRDMMRLCFLMERTYALYPKWFGTAFAKLECGPSLSPILARVLKADGWQARDAALVPAYEFVARKQNALGICERRSDQAALFFERPFHAIHLHARFADALRGRISAPEVAVLFDLPLIGGIDQFGDSTDLLSDARMFRHIAAFHTGDAPR